MTEGSIPSDATFEEASSLCAVFGKLLLPQLLAVVCTLARVQGVVQEMAFLVAHRFYVCVKVLLWVCEKASGYKYVPDLKYWQYLTWLFCKWLSACWPNFPHRSDCRNSTEFVLWKQLCLRQ